MDVINSLVTSVLSVWPDYISFFRSHHGLGYKPVFSVNLLEQTFMENITLFCKSFDVVMSEVLLHSQD